MRRGQSTLEYIMLIGIGAAALIVMLVYVSRGHQGNLRSRADQLSIEQYAPGNTTSNNLVPIQSKTLDSTAGAGSSTTTEKSAHPIGEINKPLQGNPDAPENTPERAGLLGQIGGQWEFLYTITNQWEKDVVQEGLDVAAAVFAGLWPWSYTSAPAGQCFTYETQLATEGLVLNNPDPLNLGLLQQAADMEAAWPKREPNKTTSTSWSSESGKIETHKDISETLGDL